MNIAGILKERRRAMGLSQFSLAKQSGVSLPSIQKIESGGSNPSLKTLSALLSVVGLEVISEPMAPDWDELIAYGLPMTGSNKRKVLRTPERLEQLVASACLYLKECSESERIHEALESLLLAAKLSFPTYFEKRLFSKAIVKDFFPKKIEGRHIKLARMARSKLVEVL